MFLLYSILRFEMSRKQKKHNNSSSHAKRRPLKLKTTSHYDSSVVIFHEYIMISNGKACHVRVCELDLDFFNF